DGTVCHRCSRPGATAPDNNLRGNIKSLLKCDISHSRASHNYQGIMWFVTGKADPQVMGTVAQAPKGIPSLIVRGNTRSGISEYHRSSCHRHTATVSDRAGDYAPVALRPDHLSLVLPGTR